MDWTNSKIIGMQCMQELFFRLGELRCDMLNTWPRLFKGLINSYQPNKSLSSGKSFPHGVYQLFKVWMALSTRSLLDKFIHHLNNRGLLAFRELH